VKEVVVELLADDRAQTVAPVFPASVDEDVQRAARRSLRAQIVKLERELADAFLTAVPLGGLDMGAVAGASAPRLLDLGELERVRDCMAQRLHMARTLIGERAEAQEAARVHLERMLLEPGRYRFHRITREQLGEPGCGAFHVRPRLGLIGMLMGWWQVKLSSGCPLPGGHGLASAARPRRGASLALCPPGEARLDRWCARR
jgi:hypothetical protein